MKREDYALIEGYMLECMKDSAHDKDHIYRVLNVALEIAEKEENCNNDILISACLLHDIARPEQYENPALDHAVLGAEKAYKFLIENGFGEEFSKSVKSCIRTHRFRGNDAPESIEAKILFDADKIDVTGTLGIARTLQYKAGYNEPLYSFDENGNVSDGTYDASPSFFQEYRFKLEKVYDKIITEAGREIAEKRRKSAVSFYESMLSEVRDSYKNGKRILEKSIK